MPRRVFRVEAVGRVPGSSELVVRALGTVAADGLAQAKKTAHQRWARWQTELTWLRVSGASERVSVIGRRSGHGGL